MFSKYIKRFLQISAFFDVFPNIDSTTGRSRENQQLKQNTPFSINQVEKMISLSYYLGC